MAKKIKTGTIIFFVFLILGLVIAGILINDDQSLNPLSIGVLSMSNIEVNEDGSKILVTIVPKGTDQLEIYFTPDELNEQLESQGYKATTSSILRLKFIESSKKFYFTDDELNAIKLLKITDMGNYYGFGTSKSAIISYCKNEGYPNTISAFWTDTGFFAISNVNCIEYFNNGYVNSFSTGLGTDGFKVQFDLDGEKGYITGDEQFISMANGKALITWQGSLLGINQLGAPNYDVFHIENQWYLIGKNAYSSVSSGFSQFISCMDSTNWLGTRPNVNDFNSCKSIYYGVFNNHIKSKNSEYVSQVSNAEAVSFSQGVMYVNLKQPTFNPVFTIELDASKVGLIRLSGEPIIESCIPMQMFDVAGTKSVSATIKNIGNDEGLFDFKITCDNEDMSGHADSLNFYAGETKSVNFQIYGGNPGTTTNHGACFLKVTDRVSQKSVSCGYSMSVDYKSGISDCIGDETRCSGDLKSVYNCVNGKWVRSECIGDLACGYKNNIAQCLDEEGDIVTGKCADCDAYAKDLILGKIFPSQSCLKKILQNSVFCIWSILKLFVIPFVFIFSLIFGVQILNKLLKGQYVWLVWILSIILSFLVTWLTYILFWLGVVILLIYGIFRVAINFIPGVNIMRRKKK